MTKAEPRIPLIERSEWTDEVRDVFAVLQGADGWENGPRFDILLVLAQHPALAQPFMNFGKHLMLNSTVPDRARELVTLYVGWKCKSNYEWAAHVSMGLEVGLTEDEIEAVKQGPDSPQWSDSDRNLLRAVDQMQGGYNLDDELWAALSKEFDHRQMIDLLFTIGHYIMFAAVLNGLRIQPEAGHAEVAKKFGIPRN